jgi:hypothetical protein
MAKKGGWGANGLPTNEEYYENCIKIEFERCEGLMVFRIDIIKGLQKVMDVKQIKRINQCNGNNLVWYVGLCDTLDAKALIGKTVTIKEHEVHLQSPLEEKFVTLTYKVMWLPIHFPIVTVAGFLCAGSGKVVSKKELMCREEGFQHIGTGIYNVTIKYPYNTNLQSEMYEKLCGIRTIGNQRALISMYGAKIKCLFCEQAGHRKLECPKYALVCEECGKRGHLKCNMATRLQSKSVNNEQTGDYDEDHEETTHLINTAQTAETQINATARTTGQSDNARVGIQKYNQEFPLIGETFGLATDQTTTPSASKTKRQRAEVSSNENSPSEQKSKQERKENEARMNQCTDDQIGEKDADGDDGEDSVGDVYGMVAEQNASSDHMTISSMMKNC